MTGKGLRFSWDWHDTWKEAHAKAFTVAKAMSAEVLMAIRGEVEAAIQGGATQQEFERRLAPRLKELGWWGRVEQENGKTVTLGSPWRLKVIHQTNLQTSYMAGRWKAMTENAEARPYWQYVAVMDSRTRLAHRALHGKVFRCDDPFWKKFHPPNGWGCRCRVRALAPDQVRDLSVESSEGRIGSEERVIGRNRETGAPIRRPVSFYRLPNGLKFAPDPGWDYNPGEAAWQPDLDRFDAETARQYLEGAITGPAFSRFFRGEVGGKFPVAVLGEPEKRALGSKSQVVTLSLDTMEKQLSHHPELRLEEYQKLPRITDGEVIQQDEHRLIFFRVEDRLYKAVVKVTRDGQELYLVSFYRTDEAEMQRDSRRGKRIDG
ncbi:MAG: minor capsid protein [Magnetococcales bacterium]|nr:minor capsid protein [Magnetococcales bacterium]